MNKKKTEIIVIGHRNPDTDSVASSYALTELKKCIGVSNISSCRCGDVNERTDYLFKKFNVPLPEIKNDIYPRVKNIVDRNSLFVKENESLFFALGLLEQRMVSRIPVINAKHHYSGMLSLFSLLGAILLNKAGENDNSLTGRNVYSSLKLMNKVLEGEPLSLFHDDVEQDFSVYVAAMNIESFKEHVPYQNPEKLAIIVGDRTDIHLQAINIKVRLLIVTGSKGVDPLVLQLAKERNISIIRTPLDSATVVRRLKLSCPVRTMMQDNVAKFYTDDILSEIRHTVYNDNDDVFPVISRNNELVGTFNRLDFSQNDNYKLIMVDHNEYEQSVPGVEEVQIIEIVDHHRLNLPPQNLPIKINSDIVGSTCTLVTEMYLLNQVEIPAATAGILLGGIISDTLLLRSPTTTERDKKMLQLLEKKSGIKADSLMHEIFAIGSVIARSTPEEIFAADSKTFTHAERFNFIISQVEELGFNEFYAKFDSLLQAAKIYAANKKCDFFGLLVTNVEKENSLLLAVGSAEILDRLPYRKLQDNLYDLPGILSRKKQLLPGILKLLDNL